MGQWISQLMSIFGDFSGSGKESRILMLGLDAAGKTTILYKVKLNEVVTTIPTIGFNVETVAPCKGINFTVWDVGGQVTLRRLWRHYFQDTNGLMFIVDSCDVARMCEAREELEWIVSSDEMRGVPVVVVANKQDLPNAQSPAYIIEALGLRKMAPATRWHVQTACAVDGEGVLEAMQAMARLVKEAGK